MGRSDRAVRMLDGCSEGPGFEPWCPLVLCRSMGNFVHHVLPVSFGRDAKKCSLFLTGQPRRNIILYLQLNQVQIQTEAN